MSRSRKPQPVNAPWQPIRRLVPDPWNDAKRAALRADAASRNVGVADGVDLDAWMAATEAESMAAEVWGSNRYLVHVDRRDDGSVESLSIRRSDRKPIRDWRDLQRIKNELAGAETEAVELFPADRRLVDSANQYWLWCLPPGQLFPFGFMSGLVDSVEVAGSRQRPLPADGSYTARPAGSVQGLAS